MAFRSKRGRPRADKPLSDSGTPELIAKRACGVTVESLDLCFEKELITTEQHWCGVHFRWLFTLLFGAPTVKAIDPLHFGGKELKPENPEWKAARSREYLGAAKALEEKRLLKSVLDVCVYNHRPVFLLPPKDLSRPLALGMREKKLEALREGLDLLAIRWGRSKPLLRHSP